MRYVLTRLIALSVFLASTTRAAEPDWKARYTQLKQEELKNFTRTAIKGKQLSVTLANGRKVTGTLAGLTDQGVVLSVGGKYQSIPRTGLGTDSRTMLFAADYAEIKAMARLKKEQDEYNARTGGKQNADGAAAKSRKHPGYVVVANSDSGGHMHGRIIMKGSVMNRTGVPLLGVKAYITFRDMNGKVLGTWSAPIESQTLPPDSQCSYEVMCQYNRQAAGTQVEFKTGDGQELETRYHE